MNEVSRTVRDLDSLRISAQIKDLKIITATPAARRPAREGHGAQSASAVAPTPAPGAHAVGWHVSGCRFAPRAERRPCWFCLATRHRATDGHTTPPCAHTTAFGHWRLEATERARGYCCRALSAAARRSTARLTFAARQAGGSSASAPSTANSGCRAHCTPTAAAASPR